jgi:heme oxygenase
MRLFMDSLDASGIDDIAGAVAAARHAFALFRKAAQLELETA